MGDDSSRTLEAWVRGKSQAELAETVLALARDSRDVQTTLETHWASETADRERLRTLVSNRVPIRQRSLDWYQTKEWIGTLHEVTGAVGRADLPAQEKVDLLAETAEAMWENLPRTQVEGDEEGVWEGIVSYHSEAAAGLDPKEAARAVIRLGASGCEEYGIVVDSRNHPHPSGTAFEETLYNLCETLKERGTPKEQAHRPRPSRHRGLGR